MSAPTAKPEQRTKRVVLRLDASTWRWLRALARANSGTEMHPEPCTAEKLLEQAAFCIADEAGRRTGSWEAEVAGRLLDSSGCQKRPSFEKDGYFCQRYDRQYHERWREWHDAQKAEKERKE